MKAELAAKVATLEDTVTDLAHENALLKRRLYGKRTERSHTSELQLTIGDLLAGETKLQAELAAATRRAEEAATAAADEAKPDGEPRPKRPGHGRRNLFARRSRTAPPRWSHRRRPRHCSQGAAAYVDGGAPPHVEVRARRGRATGSSKRGPIGGCRSTAGS